MSTSGGVSAGRKITSVVENQTSAVGNQTSVGLTSDLQGRKLFGPKIRIISGQHVQKGVGRKFI
jgi:hypothetical protein